MENKIKEAKLFVMGLNEERKEAWQAYKEKLLGTDATLTQNACDVWVDAERRFLAAYKVLLYLDITIPD